MVTVAPATTAPALSLTVPTIVPVVTCALEDPATSAAHADRRTAATDCLVFMLRLPRSFRLAPEPVPRPLVVPLRRGREVLRSRLEVGPDHLFHELDAEAGPVGGGGEAVVEDGLGHARDQVLPPRH